MKALLIIVAGIAAIGAIAESKKRGYIALFAISVLAYIALSILGGAT